MSRRPNWLARRAGVLLALSSLPSRGGVGDLGPEAHRFLEWMHEARLGWWQMLPVGPIGPGDSPYSSPSSFAIEPMYLALEPLVEQKLLAKSDLKSPVKLTSGPARFAEARRWKMTRIQKAFRKFAERGSMRSKTMKGFGRENRDWLEPWAAWISDMGDSAIYGPADWTDYALAVFIQFQLDQQWKALREKARRLKIRLMGDLPIFVPAASADVIAEPELFRLDRDGKPSVRTGCPPDSFAKKGQLWGHPHYNWRRHRRTGFAWWRRRVQVSLDRFDALRVDHFIGFHHAWEVPRGARTAAKGRWGKSPGRELLTALRREHHNLPLVAEDLGPVTPEVRALRDEFRLPGMHLLQFAFNSDNVRLHEIPRRSAAYTGTHDNDTTRGWFRSLNKEQKERVLTLTGGTPDYVAPDLVRLLFMCNAALAIAPLQDLLDLPRKTRMNTPGTPSGNWRWRFDRGDLTDSLADELRSLIELTGRAPQ